MTAITEDIKQIKFLVDRVTEELGHESSIGLNADLLRALLILEEKYKYFCLKCDADFHDKPGTSYKQGVNMEFYIESDDWQDISLALRRWQLDNPNWDEMLSIDTEDMIIMPEPEDD